MSKNMNNFISAFVSMNFIYFISSQSLGLISKSFYLDNMFFLLFFMTTIILFLVNLQLSKYSNITFVINLLVAMYLVFCMLFASQNLIFFYILFELSVFPLMFFISYWGYSLERVKAMLYMFLYTFIFSLPFLFYLIMNQKSINMNININMMNNSYENSFMFILFVLMMLVKMPIWSLHLWLMKAHVEASTEGSMILASVVLKLSGVAMIKMSNFNTLNFSENLGMLILSMSIIGAIYLSIYTLRQGDLKMIVAISSVIHMMFLLLMYFFSNDLSVKTLIFIMVAHGVVSPLMFLMLGIMYESISTRNMLMSKGSLKNLFYISMLWFILCCFNMSVPITLNFMSEMMAFFTLITFSILILLMASLLILMNGLFNIYLFISMSTSENKEFFFQNMETMSLFFMYSILMVTMIFMMLY